MEHGCRRCRCRGCWPLFRNCSRQGSSLATEGPPVTGCRWSFNSFPSSKLPSSVKYRVHISIILVSRVLYHHTTAIRKRWSHHPIHSSSCTTCNTLPDKCRLYPKRISLLTTELPCENQFHPCTKSIVVGKKANEASSKITTKTGRVSRFPALCDQCSSTSRQHLPGKFII
jgi:hypothetical protein